MLLTVDIGNTNIKLGVYNGERMVHHWRIATQRFQLMDEYAALLNNLLTLAGMGMQSFEGCAISCVVPSLTEQFRDLARTYLGVEPVFSSPHMRTGLHYAIDTPYELGPDRIVNSLAAHHRFPHETVIAIALGTATAIDVVTDKGEYVGGAIAPGIGISADALFRNAARLYHVELTRPPSAIGKNTMHYMQSGLILGYAGLVEGLVARMQRELDTPCTVIATGGLAEVIAGETDSIREVVPHLTLEGLRLIYMINRHSPHLSGPTEGNQA